MAKEVVTVTNTCLKCEKKFITDSKLTRICSNCRKLNYGKKSVSRNQRRVWRNDGSYF